MDEAREHSLKISLAMLTYHQLSLQYIRHSQCATIFSTSAILLRTIEVSVFFTKHFYKECVALKTESDI